MIPKLFNLEKLEIFSDAIYLAYITFIEIKLVSMIPKMFNLEKLDIVSDAIYLAYITFIEIFISNKIISLLVPAIKI